MARFYERAVLAKEIERVGKEFFLSFFLSFLSFFPFSTRDKQRELEHR